MSNEASAAELSAKRPRSATVVAVWQLINKAINELEIATPIDDPLLWAARCSMDAAELSLRADIQRRVPSERDTELVLEAVAAARASVVAATYAIHRTRDR